MKLLLTIFSTLVFLSSSAWSFSDWVQRTADCVCASGDERTATAAPYEEPLRYVQGPFQGQCIDSCKYRPFRLLSKPTEDEALVANFLHQKKFWRARIPISKVEAVDIAFEDFKHGISHMILRFRFSSGVKVMLLPLKDGAEKPPAAELRDLVVSAEAIPPKSTPFTLTDGALGSYVLSYRVLSLDDTIAWMVDDKKHRVSQYRLRLEPSERRELLRLALQESDEGAFRDRYDLFSNNCATSAIGLLEKASPKPIPAAPWFRWYDRIERAMSYQGPVGSLRFLTRKGFLENGYGAPALQNLEVEAVRYSVSQPTTRPPSK